MLGILIIGCLIVGRYVRNGIYVGVGMMMGELVGVYFCIVILSVVMMLDIGCMCFGLMV